MTSFQIEELVKAVHRIDQTWLLPREPLKILGRPSSPYTGPQDRADPGDVKTILAMDMFSDRWLLCVFHERLVQLWDLHAGQQCPLFATLQGLDTSATCLISRKIEGSGLFTSSVACLDESNSTIILVITHPVGCLLLNVKLPAPSSLIATMDILVTITAPSPMFPVRAIHPRYNLTVFSLSSILAVVDWNSRIRWIVDNADTADGELWNGIIGAKFITRNHILCMKTHTIDLYTIPSLSSPSPDDQHGFRAPDAHIQAPVITHVFRDMTFRGVSFSEPQFITFPSSTSESPRLRSEVSFLAYDVLRGLFRYKVTLDLPPTDVASNARDSPAPPYMSVRLLAAHHMAVPVSTPISKDAKPPRVPRSGLTPGARGFVTACALGPAGLRGIWIERRRGSVRRGIVGFRAIPAMIDYDEVPEVDPVLVSSNSQDGESDTEWWNGSEPAIDGHTVYEVNSYDLRDDIIQCAFSEATGTIALATRHGDLKISSISGNNHS
ncbi:hypothetical protein CERSUDRAFT_93221 [Gelatoporia subvermispora B]|uniref:Nucleoporin Nup133/Nup155-like N-terminal domain-containing protein n=1 Tax=Ceriporiopsis subvermispora (strain B) TaxID=914234 RepID=M2RL24_CERS8|nr:hypothetical protein CERSUDRAFT_93221 [Gelatoporia subvermispora B]